MSDADITVLKSKSDFDEFIKHPGSVLIHFSASWSPAGPLLHLKELLKENPNAFKTAVIDAEEVSEVSLEHSVTAVPTILLFKDGAVIDRLDNFEISSLRNFIVKHTFDGGPASLTSSDPHIAKEKETLEDRLKKLINKSRLTLFMKGSATQPRCGFSKQIIQLLDGVKADYWTFDILNDEEVRQGLKTYSDWPTYPQLYLDGEFLGGLDVVREEMNDPEFVAKLPKLD